MISYALPPAPPPSLPIAGSDQRFAIARVFCVGRNYAAHAREMGHDPNAEPPFFFLKPADTVIAGETLRIPYPPRTADLHHEVEMVVALGPDLGKNGRDLTPDQARAAIWGAAIGLDFTRRDLQATAKKASRPWDLSKGFDGCAAIGPLAQGPAPESGPIVLNVNGETRQSGDLAQMIWSTTACIAELSTYMALRPGDLVFTGTPEGVAAVSAGDTLTATCEGLPPLSVTLT